MTLLFDRALKPCHLTNAQYLILVELARSRSVPPTITELAQRSVLDRSSMSRNLRPLMRQELVRLVTGRDDKRARKAELTSAGVDRGSMAGSLRHLRGSVEPEQSADQALTM